MRRIKFRGSSIFGSIPIMTKPCRLRHYFFPAANDSSLPGIIEPTSLRVAGRIIVLPCCASLPNRVKVVISDAQLNRFEPSGLLNRLRQAMWQLDPFTSKRRGLAPAVSAWYASDRY